MLMNSKSQLIKTLLNQKWFSQMDKLQKKVNSDMCSKYSEVGLQYLNKGF